MLADGCLASIAPKPSALTRSPSAGIPAFSVLLYWAMAGFTSSSPDGCGLMPVSAHFRVRSGTGRTWPSELTLLMPIPTWSFTEPTKRPRTISPHQTCCPRRFPQHQWSPFPGRLSLRRGARLCWRKSASCGRSSGASESHQPPSWGAPAFDTPERRATA